MDQLDPVARRSLLVGALGAVAGVAGVGPQHVAGATPTIPGTGRAPLWEQAQRSGIVFGSSVATWQLHDHYKGLQAREAGLLLTEDDLLWYQLKPGPEAALGFAPGDRIVKFAEHHKQLTIGAHLVWDEGFGEGWSREDLWRIRRRDAERVG